MAGATHSNHRKETANSRDALRRSFRENLRPKRDNRGRSSGSRIVLLAAPSHTHKCPARNRFAVAAPDPCDRVQWLFAAVVPGYSGGTATALHRFPYSSRPATSRRDTSCQAGHSTARRSLVKSRPWNVRGGWAGRGRQPAGSKAAGSFRHVTRCQAAESSRTDASPGDPRTPRNALFCRSGDRCRGRAGPARNRRRSTASG